jgi:predicted P-loop ATPase
MAEEGQENGMNTPDFEETDGPEGKSKVSLLGGATAGVQIKATIDNFYRLITNHYGRNLRLNEMTGKPEFYDSGRKAWREWTDAQESEARAYFEGNYGMYSQAKLADALAIYFKDHKVNPLLRILDKLEWDGKPRVEHFLHDVMKAEDTDYIRECSRLIFAGGVHRAYEPGCKFDDMIVLIGGQSAGKSTIVRWLNLDDSFFREIKTIAGKEGIEAIRGVWIGEVAELMAMTRVKEAEAVKAYITSQEDSYRPPYGKHVQTIPRRCMFIGTTNNPQFLTDKTGNRRFYPVKCQSFAYKLYDHEKEVKEYITQAWAEAVHLYKEGQLQPFAKKEVLDQIREAQEAAMEDDWRIGAIEQYLEDQKKASNSTVSVIELWHNALNEPDESKPSRKDSIELTQIITNIPGWVQCPNPVRTKWGRQKAFRRDNFAALWR